MAKAKMRLGLAFTTLGISPKLLGQTLLALPEDTKLVAIESKDGYSDLILEHPDFVEGSSIDGKYSRVGYLVNKGTDKEEFKSVDQFIGLDLDEALGRK